jgi:hypothetical protein
MTKIKIYILRDPISEEVRYCGKTIQTLEDRLWAHLHEAKRGKVNHKCCWIRSVFNQGSKPIIELLDEFTEEELGATWQFAETFYITRLKDLGYNLTNQSKGGDGLDSDVAKQLWSDPEYRLKMSNAQKKGWDDDSRRQGLVDRLNKRWADPEARKENSLKQKNDWKIPEIRLQRLSAIFGTKQRNKIAKMDMSLFDFQERVA